MKDEGGLFIAEPRDKEVNATQSAAKQHCGVTSVFFRWQGGEQEEAPAEQRGSGGKKKKKKKKKKKTDTKDEFDWDEVSV